MPDLPARREPGPSTSSRAAPNKAERRLGRLRYEPRRRDGTFTRTVLKSATRRPWKRTPS
jgi:hypothetical protein